MKVFISYRRDDSVDIAGRLADRLADKLGVSSIFMDIASIPAGADFAQVIREEIEQCDVLLAVIGPKWADAIDSSGRRRLDNPDDFIRREIESALRRAIPVVPVLVGGSSMPRSQDMPEPLRELAYRNAAVVRSGPDFRSDTDRLVEALKRLGPRAELDVGTLEEIRVFVSHSTLDRAWVEAEVIKVLHTKNIRTWYSKSEIKTGAEWEREIKKGMEACDWFLLVASPNAAQSDWVRDEVYWAIFNRPSKIVTVVMEECNLWDFHIRIPRLQHIDFRREPNEARQTLLGVFGRA